MKNKLNKKTKKQLIKKAIKKLIATVIYYILCSILGVAIILLFFGTVGAITTACENSNVYCICFVIVNGYIITRFIIKEVYSSND